MNGIRNSAHQTAGAGLFHVGLYLYQSLQGRRAQTKLRFQ